MPGGASGSETNNNNDTWDQHTDGTEADTTDQTATYDSATQTWTITAYTYHTHQVDEFTDTLANNDSSSPVVTSTSVIAGSDAGTTTTDETMTGSGNAYTDVYDSTTTYTYNWSENDQSHSDITFPSGPVQEVQSSQSYVCTQQETSSSTLHQESSYTNGAWATTYLWKWQPETCENSDFCDRGPPRWAGRHNRHCRGLRPGLRAPARSERCWLLSAGQRGRYPGEAWRNGVRRCGDATGLGIARSTVYRWQPALGQRTRAAAHASVT